MVMVLEVTRSVEIDRGAEVVRRQFGDVAHHAETGVHRGVVFEIIEEDHDRCRYRQISAVGPFKITQEFERRPTGPLINRVVRGRFAGGAITVEVDPRGEGKIAVKARLSAPLSTVMSSAAPLLRAQIGRQRATALAEDEADLEEGSYGRS